MNFDRRRFLSTTVLTGLGLIAGSRAFALSLDDATPSERSAYVAACRAKADDHDALIAEVRAMLDGQSVSPERQAEVLRSMRCPLCGCTLDVG